MANNFLGTFLDTIMRHEYAEEKDKGCSEKRESSSQGRHKELLLSAHLSPRKRVTFWIHTVLCNHDIPCPWFMPSRGPPSHSSHGGLLQPHLHNVSSPPSTPGTDFHGFSSPPPDDIQTALTAYKRRAEALEEENERLKERKPTKPKTTRTLGQPIRKVVALFAPIASLVQEYECRCEPDVKAENEELKDVDIEQLNEDEHEEYEQCLELKRSQDRDHEGFRLLCIYVYSHEVNHAELKDEYAALELGANAAHSEDIHNGAMELADWLNQ
ncbi:hypothetical protein C8R42DRAFT_646251 [Lentinula raphanica]|nr:hypothetical protein C8R42DRAFT_646251 [Lentinula raphanica]